MSIIKKNILIVTSEFPPLPGGIGNHAFNLSKHLADHNYEIQVIADQRALDNEESVFDSRLNFKVYRIALKRFRTLMYFKRILLAFKLTKDSDVIIASGKFSLWVMLLVSYFYKKIYIAVIHGSEVNFTNTFLKKSIDKSLKRASHVIAVSNFTKSLVDRLKLKSIHIISNGFNAEDWDLKSIVDKDLKGAPKLLTVGNVTERKGQLNVIKHLPLLIEKYPKIHYHCVGYPTEKDSLLKYAKTMRVDAHITFHGRAKQEDLVNYYYDSDIFVMLSTSTKTGDVEGFGIAVLEANYIGVPAIGSKNCGIEDAINNNKSGVLIDPKNAFEFVSALETILKNKEQFSENAKKWADKHTWDLVINKYIDIIEM